MVAFGRNKKAQLATKTVFAIAQQHANHFREAWKYVYTHSRTRAHARTPAHARPHTHARCFSDRCFPLTAVRSSGMAQILNCVLSLQKLELLPALADMHQQVAGEQPSPSPAARRQKQKPSSGLLSSFTSVWFSDNTPVRPPSFRSSFPGGPTSAPVRCLP